MTNSGAHSPSEPEQFAAERRAAMHRMAANGRLRQLAAEFMAESGAEKYSFNFTWMGLPILQYPQDLVAMQELIWRARPRAIVETGVARGGSLVYYASLLKLIEPEGIVIGVDIDIRPHNRAAIEAHPLAPRIRLIEGSSVAPEVLHQVKDHIGTRSPVLVCLDSHHTHDHVLQELELYSPLVTPGSFLVVFDTVIEHVPPECVFGKPWGKGNSPASAVAAFLREQDQFVVDEEMDQKLLITVAPGGYLRRVK